nr:MAG TPA: hypothetical protein [Caudoviricetes sp.]DAF40772.1 MAG TPA: hypothetical protein [Caudoviricetes sp.]
MPLQQHHVVQTPWSSLKLESKGYDKHAFDDTFLPLVVVLYL